MAMLYYCVSTGYEFIHKIQPCARSVASGGTPVVHRFHPIYIVGVSAARDTGRLDVWKHVVKLTSHL